LKTFDFSSPMKGLIQDSENIINGAKISEENKDFIILQSKSGLLTVLEIDILMKIKKTKEIDLKTIGFLKFSLNPLIFECEENNSCCSKSNNSMEKAFFVYPNYVTNVFICRSYEEKVLNEIPFSKQVNKLMT